MKKFLIVLAILVGIAAICVNTCPDKQAHVVGLNEIVKEAIYQRSQESLKKSLDAINKREKKFYEGEKKRKSNNSDTSVGFEFNPNGPRRSFDAEREMSNLIYDGPTESSTAEAFILKISMSTIISFSALDIWKMKQVEQLYLLVSWVCIYQ